MVQFETREFVMGILNWKQGLLCDKSISLEMSNLSIWQRKSSPDKKLDYVPVCRR